MTAPRPDHFDSSDRQPAMKAVVTIGNWGYDRLIYRVF